MMRTFTANGIKRNEGNCLLYGCSALVLVSILASLAFWLIFQFMIQRVRDQYTETNSIALPQSELSGEQIQEIIERVDAYAESMRNDEPLEPVTLTQDEINALIQYHPELTRYAGLVYISIDGEEIKGELSVPLDVIPGFGGRYFNGTAVFTVSLQDGEFAMYVDQASLNGEPLPEELLQNVRGKNLAEDAQSDPESRDLIGKIEAIAVRDGAVVITPFKRKEPPAL